VFGVVPDLAVFGKAMASGFPIACIAGRSELFDGVANGVVTHAGTFNGNNASVERSDRNTPHAERSPGTLCRGEGGGSTFPEALGRNQVGQADCAGFCQRYFG